jgi:hypothetical protein
METGHYPEQLGPARSRGDSAEHARRPVPKVASAKGLAKVMAGMTRTLRDSIASAFEHEQETGRLHDWFAAFRRTLIPDLRRDQFADLFAQTLAYGLFAARVHAPPAEPFSRNRAADDLPKTDPLLGKLLAEILRGDVPDSIARALDGLVELLKHADMRKVLGDFGKGEGREDPVVHFYETFLAAYDPAMRGRRGVYCTPQPVVSFMVRAVDHLLETRFRRKMGLADERTLILDPATGTAAFLSAVIEQIRRKFARRAGAWNGYVAKHLLGRILGFELLMAPYAIAHLKLGMQLRVTGYRFAPGQRPGVYLTHTLEETALKSEQLFARRISEEARAAASAGNEPPIAVVLGNPPYSGVSANAGQWIEALMDDYKITVRHEERQRQRLSNDYIKFIRFGQWRLEKTGRGILAFITDNGYLKGLLSRDMRHALLRSFSQIYILDLHGAAMRGAARKTPTDENVFDITQGVAIAIFVKDPDAPGACTLSYAEIKGTRRRKYEELAAAELDKIEWRRIAPEAPNWYFVPAPADRDYVSWPSFLSIIGTGKPKEDRDRRYGTGIKTRHDPFAVGWSPQDAVSRVERIANRPEADQQLIKELRLCTTAHFDIQKARARASAGGLEQHVRPISFRPFDTRYVVYLREFICEPKAATMRHLLDPANVALAVLRRDRKELCAGHFVVRGLAAKDLVSNLDDAVVWPLYEHACGKRGKLPLHTGDPKRPNLSAGFLNLLAEKLKRPQAGPHGLPKGITPEQVFGYLYAVLHSPAYRARYAPFLADDFPRLPLTGDFKLFRALAAIGAELAALHLLESAKVHDFLTEWPIPGDNLVEDVRYSEADRRVWINRSQYFGGVPKASG